MKSDMQTIFQSIR